jgi:hypothetical protein
MQLELQKQKMAEEQRLSSLEKEEGIRRRKLTFPNLLSSSIFRNDPVAARGRAQKRRSKS